MARSRSTADTQTASGGPVSPSIAGKNAVINGGFDIWQRGTSVSIAGSSTGYTADRWFFTGATNASTISRQVTGDTTNLPNIQYCARVQRNSGQTGTGGMSFNQSFETVNSIPFAGKTATISFYARKGANYSPTNSALEVDFYYGTGTDQNVGTGYTGVGALGNTVTLTTTWQRFTYTATLPTSVTELAAYFYWVPTGTAGTNDYFEITGVQLELGSTATPFSRAQGTIQGELAACQRYYQKSYDTGTAPQTNSTSPGGVMAVSGNVGVSGGLGTTVLKVEMRVAPTVTIYSYTSSTAARVSDNSGADLAANSGVANYIGTRSFNTQNLSAGTINAAFNGFLYHYVASAEL
jgi:hypothetical protein